MLIRGWALINFLGFQGGHYMSVGVLKESFMFNLHYFVQ